MLGLLLALSVGWFGTAAAAAERVALVIGNGLYRHVGTLPNPSNDARAITAALEAVGFEVVAGYDLDADGMAGAVERFELELEGARVGLVYYAGHGLGMDGVNYLLPVDLKLESKSAVKRDAVSVDWLLNDVMQGGEERVSILMLDACRNNPFARSFAARTRGEVGNGLAEVQAKTGAYIAFATAPDNVASDGSGGNSPFTAAVLRHLPTPGLEINDMMTLVRNEVHTETGKAQLPWANSALLGRFYFVPPGEAAASTTTNQVLFPQQPPAEELRLAAWQRVETALLPTTGARLRVQQELEALGHAPGRPDGRFGPGTRTAIRDFQVASGLGPTGYADKPTLALLERQVARLAPPAGEPAAQQPRPSRSKVEAGALPPRPAAASASAGPAASRVPGGTMGVCTAAGGGWASERHLTYDQCRKVGGRFAPF